MKAILSISGAKFILTVDQLAAVTAALQGAEAVESKWLGAGKGPNGTNSVDIISTEPMSSRLTVSIMSADEYNALKFMTASLREGSQP